MILLSVRDLSRQFDADPVLNRVTFDVRHGEKLGLIGPNGAGKTTLLHILAGLDDPDEGHVEHPKSAEIALLQQEANFPPDRILFDEAKEGLASLYRLQADAAGLAEQISVTSDPQELDRLQKRYDHLQHELERLDAFHIDHRVDEVLSGLGFSREEYDRPLSQFSGGQQSRAQLARLLLRTPAVLLLDEPTNHLDIAATEWLEGYLANSNKSLIVVSHDRYFLDRVTNRILELSGGAIESYRGNFSAYWKQKEECNKVLGRTYEKQQEFIAKTEEFIRRNKFGQKHAQASDREKKLARVEPVQTLTQLPDLSMGFGEASRTGDWVIDAVEVSKGFDSPLFTDVSLRIARGDRVGIFGPNGSGKTTLLRTLLGELAPDTGSVRLGTGVKVGYYDQQMSLIDPASDAIEAVRPAGDLTVTPGTIRSLLARFGIRGEMVFRKVGMMSGGERSKVLLAKLAAQRVNLLVLDEPTNHLDLQARASLEDALKRFAGTVMFVSHDRYFIDRVAQCVIVLEPERWRLYEGNYSRYLQFVENQSDTEERASNRTGGRSHESTTSERELEQPSKRKRKFPYRKVVDLEAEIAECEATVAQLETDLADPEVHRDGERIKAATEAFEETQNRLEELYAHWEEAVELN